ncbi:hypothetical protein RHGRI_007011 [Rhododendron griersonianum]|uniref:GDSL esterase/lipase n=1 Tax=Rhododendron griersonianum TaxID=479676 RepID=A0AAV6KW18_9ERIC|nr:hypothetical protein RHGRI_007011 [Rhododendron griersonianum]
MEKQNLLCFLLSCCFFLLPLLSDIQGVQGSYSGQYHRHGGGGVYGFHPKKLFVFGDSYADTGNLPKSFPGWQVPYGITFPGKPEGHFSDGRVLTEFLAKYLGLKSPVPYAMRKHKRKLARYGMNFAYGGTGVFNTTVAVGVPNMTAQIDFFQNLLKESACKKSELKSSLSLVTVSGNDYTTYLAEGGSAQGVPSFVARVVNQIAVNMKRIHDMGVTKVAVGAIEPLGCLPEVTFVSSFQRCNETSNAFAILHNSLLQQAVAKLNSECKDSGAFIILDLYDAFDSILNRNAETENESVGSLLDSTFPNDSSFFYSNEGFPSYITRVVNQIAVNLKRIHDMGVRKVAVKAIEPFGCLPEFTVANSFQQCNETANTLAKLHNTLLQLAVAKLNSESKYPGAFIILDLYDAFVSVLNNKETAVKFESPILKPCCFGTSIGYRCGSLNAKGEKMYTLCDNPNATFFWDNVHPTQAGWRVVFFYLKSKFEKS